MKIIKDHVQRTFQELTNVLGDLLDRWSDKIIAQPIALQLLFDLKFIGLATGSTLEAAYAPLEQRIEQMV